jgi:RNA polymerase sigma-70 factor (ECF subfamily)
MTLLPDEQRELLTLYYLNDRSIAEVSQILNRPPGTVKSRLHHARLALRTVIERKNL